MQRINARLGISDSHSAQITQAAYVSITMTEEAYEAFQYANSLVQSIQHRVTIEPHVDAASSSHGLLLRMSPTARSNSFCDAQAMTRGRDNEWKVSFRFKERLPLWLRDALGSPFDFTLTPVAAHITATGAIFLPFVELSLRRPAKKIGRRKKEDAQLLESVSSGQYIRDDGVKFVIGEKYRYHGSSDVSTVLLFSIEASGPGQPFRPLVVFDNESRGYVDWKNLSLIPRTSSSIDVIALAKAGVKVTIMPDGTIKLN